jgi:Uma2 family endonuclease
MTFQGETRVVLRNVAWDVYERLTSEAGRAGTRFTYDGGVLEIMSPSREHERVKRRIGRMIEAMTEELSIPIDSAGSTTLKSQLKQKGVEADECYYIANEPKVRGRDDLDLSTDPPPDLAVEIDISASSIDQLAIYSALGVPEVWFCDGTRVEFHAMVSGGAYARRDRSAAFPFLDAGDVERFLALRNEGDETTWIRSFRAWVQTRIGLDRGNR